MVYICVLCTLVTQQSSSLVAEVRKIVVAVNDTDFWELNFGLILKTFSLNLQDEIEELDITFLASSGVVRQYDSCSAITSLE